MTAASTAKSKIAAYVYIIINENACVIRSGQSVPSITIISAVL